MELKLRQTLLRHKLQPESNEARKNVSEQEMYCYTVSMLILLLTDVRHMQCAPATAKH